MGIKKRNGFLGNSLLLMIVIPLTLGILWACAISDDDSKKADVGDIAERMQQFVIDISRYARGLNPDFIIIPQNGAELAFNDTDPDEDNVMEDYIDAIDGIGIEELFYNGSLKVDREILGMLRILKNYAKIMVSDYVSNDANIPDAVTRSATEGFISFPRSRNNYDYKLISDYITNENENNINVLADAKNYLYLISSDSYSTKTAMMNAIKATNYDLVLIDLYSYGNGNPFTKTEVQGLKIKANGKKRLVISYVSIGSAENYRYYWQSGWKMGNPSWIKKRYEGYPNEYWVEFWNKNWQDIIFGNYQSYLYRIINAGFDGAYLDNVEAYYFLRNN